MKWTTPLASLLLLFSTVHAIQVGDSLPSADLHFGFPPESVNLRERAAGKNLLVVGLPGAFTPT